MYLEEMSRKSSILVVFLVSAVPASVFIFVNFFFFRRGWHIDEKERFGFYWLVRIILSPALAIVCVHFFGKSVNGVKLFIYQAFVFVVYTSIHVMISLLICIALISHFDGRYYNLFNTIKEESTIVNLVIFTMSITILYCWQYASNKSVSLKAINELKKALAELEKQKATPTVKLDTLSIKQGHRNIIVPVNEIYFLKSDGPYIKIITSGRTYLLTGRLYDIYNKLPHTFLRIHRSQIINSAFVKEIRSLLNGDYNVVMKNDVELKGSRTYRNNIKSMLI
jgi:hypothetical protein